MGRRPVPDHLKKSPQDYPQLAFRLSKQDKAKLMRMAEETAKALTKAGVEDRYWTKGDAFVLACYKGFEAIRKSLKR